MVNVLIVLVIIVPMAWFMDLPALREDATARDRILYSLLMVSGLALLVLSQINQSSFSPLTTMTQTLKGIGEWVLQWQARL